jgi:hypothetical protein
MCTDFIVFKDHLFAHRKNKSDNYVCYRTVICHALLWKINHSSKEEAIQAFVDFAQAVRNSKEHEDKTFLSLFIAEMRNEKGYIIVDKSRGYYPLVAYPFKNKKGAARSEALQYAIEDLSENLPKICEVLEHTRDWDIGLQDNLQNNFFHYTEDNVKH